MVKKYNPSLFDVFVSPFLYLSFYAFINIVFMFFLSFGHKLFIISLISLIVFFVILCITIFLYIFRSQYNILLYDKKIEIKRFSKIIAIDFTDVKEILCRNIVGIPSIKEIFLIMDNGEIHKPNTIYNVVVNCLNRKTLKEIVVKILEANNKLLLDEETIKFCEFDVTREERFKLNNNILKSDKYKFSFSDFLFFNTFPFSSTHYLVIIFIILNALFYKKLIFIIYVIIFVTILYLNSQVIIFEDKVIIDVSTFIVLPYTKVKELLITEKNFIPFLKETLLIDISNKKYNLGMFIDKNVIKQIELHASKINSSFIYMNKSKTLEKL